MSLLQKAGYEIIFPKDMDKLCCGTIWESKGMLDIADRNTAELAGRTLGSQRTRQIPRPL